MESMEKGRIEDVLRNVEQALGAYRETVSGLQSDLRTTQAELDTRLKILSQAALMSEADTRGVITYANDKFCEVSGYTLEELIGKPHNILRHPDMPKEFFKEMWDTIKAGKVFQGEIKNRRKDGSAYWVIATVAPVLGPDGHPVKYVSARFDITVQKLIEEQLKSRQVELMDELLANMRVASEIVEGLAAPPPVEVPHFIFHKPQHILSGDFGWLHGEKGYLIGMVGDSIGHGVSAAFVAVVFKQLMQFLVGERGIWRPSMIAEALDSQVTRVFSRKLKQKITADGIIFALDIHRRAFSYSSFQGKGILIRKGKVYHLDRMPFSFGELLGKAADEGRMDLEAGDRLYFFSDGLVTQCSGEGKKLGRSGSENLLLSLQQYPIERQKEVLEAQILELTKQKPQSDDILVMGIEVV